VALRDAFNHCEALVRAHDKDRFLAGLFAPPAERAHLYALYAFAGEIAQVREAAREPLPGELRLLWWRDALDGQREAAGNPVAAALLDTMAACALPKEALIGLIDAHAFDLYDEAMASLADLESHAGATAGTVFALAAKILGGDAAAGPARAAAAPAGIAQGLAQVLRTFPRDRARRNSYVPIDLLGRYGVTRAEIDAGRATPGLAAALAAISARARAAYDEFRVAATALPEETAPAFLTVALVPSWLDRLDGADPFTPVELPQWRRQWRLWRAARRWPASLTA